MVGLKYVCVYVCVWCVCGVIFKAQIVTIITIISSAPTPIFTGTKTVLIIN